MKSFNSLINSINKYNSAESGYGEWDDPRNPLLAPIAIPLLLCIFAAVTDAVLGTRIISSLLDLLP